MIFTKIRVRIASNPTTGANTMYLDMLLADVKNAEIYNRCVATKASNPRAVNISFVLPLANSLKNISPNSAQIVATKKSVFVVVIPKLSDVIAKTQPITMQRDAIPLQIVLSNIFCL